MAICRLFSGHFDDGAQGVIDIDGDDSGSGAGSVKGLKQDLNMDKPTVTNSNQHVFFLISEGLRMVNGTLELCDLCGLRPVFERFLTTSPDPSVAGDSDQVLPVVLPPVVLPPVVLPPVVRPVPRRGRVRRKRSGARKAASERSKNGPTR